ncbi:MAG: anti-sigma factor [Candidatus Eremiobacteraeota bacterium]|nr:anti-sigma factor [Candidatus Eremiobacteraeota bacterium]
MNAHEMRDNVAAYVLGGLTPPEAQAFSEHLHGCAICMAEYRTLKPVADALALAPEPSQNVSPLVKQRLMREICTQRAPSRAFLPYALAAACLALALLLSIGYAYRSAQNARIQAQLNQSNTALADLASPNARHYPVPGGQLVRSGAKIYVVMRTLPNPPAGNVYQMWTLQRGATSVAPSITFVPLRGETLVQLPVDATHLTAVAMSVEPPGGSKQPTTKPRFLVRL